MRTSAGQQRTAISRVAVTKPSITESLENCCTRYVHLCCGDIIELPSVTSIRVTETCVVALHGTETVASYPRASVYFVADRPMEPPSLN